jgi:hypothetical protein
MKRRIFVRLGVVIVLGPFCAAKYFRQPLREVNGCPCKSAINAKLSLHRFGKIVPISITRDCTNGFENFATQRVMRHCHQSDNNAIADRIEAKVTIGVNVL